MKNTSVGSVDDQRDRPANLIATDHEFSCTGCGFDPAQMQPGRAVSASRSFGRRWREVFAASDTGATDVPAIVSCSEDACWTPIDRAWRAAFVLDSGANALSAVWLRDQPELEQPETGTGGLVSRDIDEALCALSTAGELLARTIEGFGLTGWDRVGIQQGRRVTALHITRAAIHESVHHLRLAADHLRPLGV